MNQKQDHIANENVGERLARLRKKIGLSQATIAKRFNLDRRTISSYENGTSDIPGDVIIKYSRLYHVSSDYILGINYERGINVDGLTNEEYKAISVIVNALTVKNAK